MAFKNILFSLRLHGVNAEASASSEANAQAHARNAYNLSHKQMGTSKIVLSAAVVLLAAAGLLDLYQITAAQAQQGDPYQVETQLMRMQAAVAALPARAPVGYVTDMDVATPRGLLAFSAARYALAPRLLVPGANTDAVGWVLGNFSQPQDYQAFAAQRGLAFSKDLGEGVVLFQKGARK